LSENLEWFWVSKKFNDVLNLGLWMSISREVKSCFGYIREVKTIDQKGRENKEWAISSLTWTSQDSRGNFKKDENKKRQVGFCN